MQRNLLAVIALVIVAFSGYFFLNSFIYNQKQAKSSNIESYRGELTGEYICLPHLNQTGPQTLECAFGIKTEANEYYALDFNLIPQEQANLKIGDKFTASGTITPAEMLSTDFWQKYPIEGIFSITDSIQKN